MTAPLFVAIDDEPDIVDFVGDVAKTIGFDVKTTSNPREFLAIIAAGNVDVAAIDVVMPGMDGIELVNHLADDGCRARLLFVSGYEGRYLKAICQIASAKGLNILGTMSKPVRLRELKDQLQTAVDGI